MKKHFKLVFVLLLAAFSSVSFARDMPQKEKKMKTIRLVYGQWQGGDYGKPYTPIYGFGAQLMAWLAPASDAPLLEVPVDAYTGAKPETVRGVVWKDTVIRQMNAARSLIDQHKPDRIITFGGDCHVSQAPFAWLNERYDGNVGILWIDAHPDLSTPNETARAHAMVLGNLLGGGDAELAAEVKTPYKPENILYIGMDEMLPKESALVQKYGIPMVKTEDVAADSKKVTDWIRQRNLKHVVIHLDVDVLDPRSFYSVLPNYKGLDFETIDGKMTIPQLTRLLNDIDGASTVVGISFAEYMPWDAQNLKTMLESLPFMK
ncbi:arginase family protein [Oxalobacter sp. OttesenSCG-928-P03]|nr:arginase family protein [Oxalobacter sp. OttesenSCG-928-P03]